VILSQHVNRLPFTRDWVVLENGIAKNKDIWVFEPCREFGTINVVTPFVKHYVLFDTIDSHLAYLMQIVRSYDDSHVLPTFLAAAGLGALLVPKDRTTGGGVAAIAGLILSDRGDQRPIGMDGSNPGESV
jgi:hypothetical protein